MSLKASEVADFVKGFINHFDEDPDIYVEVVVAGQLVVVPIEDVATRSKKGFEGIALTTR